jgi:hypothetical protein
MRRPAVACIASLAVLAGAGSALADGTSEEQRAFALVAAIGHSEQALLAKLGPVTACVPKGHRGCLPHAARALAKVASDEQRPVRQAVRRQDRSCSRDAGNRYLRALRSLHSAALALSHARSRKEFRAVARRMDKADGAESAAADTAMACWRKTLT